jgi:hypothetical protein
MTLMPRSARGQLANDGIEAAVSAGGSRIKQEAADMQLIDHHLIPIGRGVVHRCPSKRSARDDAVTIFGHIHRLRVRILFPGYDSRRIGNDELVLVADGRARHVSGPIAVAFQGQRRSGVAPVVERAGNIDGAGEFCPDTKPDPTDIGYCPHSRLC